MREMHQRLTEVLAAHRVMRGNMYDRCPCGWQGVGHEAHLANALLPLLTEAEARGRAEVQALARAVVDDPMVQPRHNHLSALNGDTSDHCPTCRLRAALTEETP